jgi:hypothetical protein
MACAEQVDHPSGGDGVGNGGSRSFDGGGFTVADGRQAFKDSLHVRLSTLGMCLFAHGVILPGLHFE